MGDERLTGKCRCRRTFLGALGGLFASLLALCTAGAGAAHGASYGYRRGHRCPRCGAQVTAIDHYGPGPGQHTHRHGSTTWYHDNQR